MRAASLYRGRTIKSVVIEQIGDATDEQILSVALAKAGETKNTLFNWDLTRDDARDMAVVILHTD